MLAAWVNLMLRNRDKYKKLVQEVRATFKSASEIRWATVKDLRYLNAVNHEVLRICAPVPTNLCRVVPPGGAVIDGYPVPGGVGLFFFPPPCPGPFSPMLSYLSSITTNMIHVIPKTTVSLSPWAATHLPLNFSRPLEFLPERWLSYTTNSSSNVSTSTPGFNPKNDFSTDLPHASQPFSYGPRGCIGKNLTNIEQRLIMAHLVWHFDLDVPDFDEQEEEDKEKIKDNEKWDPEGDMKGLKAWVVWVKPSLWVRLRVVDRGPER